MDLTYLNEVLASEDEELPNINSAILNLINHTNTLKKDVTIIIQNQSHQFNAILKENNSLKSKAGELLKEMNLVEEKIEKKIHGEISSCREELEAKSYSLKEINLFMNILEQLLNIDSMLSAAKKNMINEKYHECAEFIKNIRDCIKFNSDKLERIEMFKALSHEVVQTSEHFLQKISEIWSECININAKSDTDNNVSEIRLCIKTKSVEEISEILKASKLLESNMLEKKFSNELLNDVLNKIIVNEANMYVQSEGRATLLLEILNNGKKPHYKEVFKNLKTTIEFLKAHLNIRIEKDQTFLSVVSSHIAQSFADSLIKNILSEAIPSSFEGFDSYKELIKNAEDFEKFLQNIGFLESSSSTLMDYARNINVLFANKICQSFLMKAKTIMKKDLHSVTTSEEISSNIAILPITYKNVLKVMMNIQEDIFLFSKCQIRHAKEFINLLYSMMTEIEKSMEFCAVRLFYTIRNIFEMYAAVVPLHHKKFLESLPQQVALFHNNCIYFAHTLINIVVKYYDKVPSVLKSHFPILLEESINLKCLAAEKLEVTISNQRNQLIYILKDSGYATLKENPKLDLNSEKSIRQCIRQLQILQAVWNEVLPSNVYNRAMGFLLDNIIQELITLIISVEDISSQTSSDLVSNFNIILERAPNLFSDEKEVYRHVRKWQKFKEFVLIMKGSLRDIDDRWANGMGPLAVEFTADQVKHLIRSLFQNSYRRAALLAKIK